MPVQEIKLTNTMTKHKEVFVPIDADNVRMYLCGPTVYDRAHLGNARNVIMFDVLFRLLCHEFGADHVTYVRNFTDVDDKIILRARQNKLMVDYKAEVKDYGAVQKYVQIAMAAMRQKLEGKVQELQEALPEGTPAKQVEKREEALAEAKFKLGQFGETEAAVAKVEEERTAAVKAVEQEK